MAAYVVLLLQKAISIYIVKFLLTGQLPDLQDGTLLLLVVIHLSTFFYFHSKFNQNSVRQLMKSKSRMVIQDTFKGYGKANSLLSSINKGMKLETNVLYFLVVLVIRCLITPLFKEVFILKFIKRKPLKFRKSKVNLVFNLLPSCLVYLTIISCRRFISPALCTEIIVPYIQIFFWVFMIGSRFVRSLYKLLAL